MKKVVKHTVDKIEYDCDICGKQQFSDRDYSADEQLQRCIICGKFVCPNCRESYGEYYCLNCSSLLDEISNQQLMSEQEDREQLSHERRRPTIICLCGSTRFQNAFMSEYAKLSEQGNIVLTVSKLIPQHEDISPELDKMRKWLHFRKIDLADEVMILNVGGYIGESTRSELEYAKQHGKTIKYLEAI